MATTINSYSVGLTLNASDYIRNSELSRKETTALKRDIEAARTPTEKFAREQERLAKALSAGTVDHATYNRLLESKRAKLLGVAEAAPAAVSATTVYTAAIGAAAAALTAAVYAGGQFYAFLRDQQNQIDDTIDAANKLGVSYNELNAVRFIGQEGGGLDAGTVDASVKNLLKQTAAAVHGDQQVAGAFAELGLNAAEMMAMGPEQQLIALAGAFENIVTPAEKIRLAMSIFGKQGYEMVGVLNQGADAMREQAAFAEEFNSLTIEQTTAVGALNDQMDRIEKVVEGAAKRLAADFAPAMLLVSEQVLGTAKEFGNISDYTQTLVAGTVYYVGLLKDVNDLLSGQARLVGAIASGNLDAAAAVVNEMITLDGGEAALNAYYKKREELEREAAKRKLADDRDAELKKAEIAFTLEEENRRKADEEAARQAEKAKAAFDRMASQALVNAEKFFDEEDKRKKQLQSELAKGPGSGIEVGSAEAAKYMAEQTNRELARLAAPDKPKPTEEQLLEEAKKQFLALEAQQAKQDAMNATLEKILEVNKENGFKRAR